MSSYYAAYGSGLKLNEEEFEAFVDRYMEANKTSREDVVKVIYDEFDDMVAAGDVYFTWSSDISTPGDRKRIFQPERVSPDECDGMRFQPYRLPDGRANVPYLDNGISNPDFIGFKDCKHETSYFFFSKRELDDAETFAERPYGSYEEFRQEFRDKMAAYLPKDFDWDAHIGRFNYTFYA